MVPEGGRAGAHQWAAQPRCCYEEGTGVEGGGAEAVKWYRKVAEQGDSDTMQALAECYRDGTGEVEAGR